MNIPIIQNFFIKKNFNAIKDKINSPNTNKIKKIILLVDESIQDYKSKILSQLKEIGIQDENITFLIFTKRKEKDKIYEFPTFSRIDLNIIGNINSTELNSIINKSS